MNHERSSILGRCPFCGADIPAQQALIEYESSGGPAIYAECPDCGDVVKTGSRVDEASQ
ncbi:MAG: hypothetical protein ACQETB_00045 [Halobacteriota archaeon]